MSKKLKIALITEYLNPQVNGIVVRFSEITKRLKESEHDLEVYGPKNHKVDYELITVRNHWNKDNFFCFPNFKLISDVITKKFDIVYFVLPPFFMWASIAFLAKLNGSKIIVSNHVNSKYYIELYTELYFNNPILKSFAYFLYSTPVLFPQRWIPDLVLAPSQIEELEIVSEKTKTGILRSGINFDEFPVKTNVDKHHNVIYVGRLAPEKNLDKLISLFSKLPKNFKLTLVGDGPYRKELQKKYGHLNIEFVGYTPHERVYEYYHAADFHLITSESETFGFTPVESMAAGTPVIYPSCHPFKELYGKEFPGLMYDLSDDESFLKCVENLYRDYNSLSTRCADFARKNFGWDEVVNDLIEKMKDLIGI